VHLLEDAVKLRAELVESGHSAVPEEGLDFQFGFRPPGVREDI